MKLNSKMLIGIICVCSIFSNAQNYVPIAPNTSSTEILDAAISVRPSERQLAWQKLEYYAFIHFGPNTFLGKEWSDGTSDPSVFNPTALDANQWVTTIKAAGMKGLILTAKHHDGFCLWPTQTTNYSVSAAPWRKGKGDLVREVAEACRRQGIQLGVYLSPWDRNHPTYGDSPAYNKIFVAQLTELLTNYGELFEVWFDGANGEGPNGKVQQYDWKAYYDLIRRLQPQAVIAVMGPDVRWCGNEAGIGRDPEWSVLPLTATSQNAIAQNSQQQADSPMFVPKNAKGSDLGSRHLLANSPALIWYPSEVDTSIRPGWFYHANQDDKVKTPEKLEQIYYSSIGMNASLLLNIPPDKRGLIHENDVENLMALKRKIDATFKCNLIKDGKLSLKKKDAKKLIDNKLETHYTLQSNQKDSTILIAFKQPQTFDRLLLQENIEHGQRVESFVFEKMEAGKWITIAAGKTIGYKRILCFEKITASKVRLRITSTRANPLLAEIGMYNSEE